MAYNRKTSHLKYESFVRARYLKKLDPSIARVIFKAGTIMFDIKVNYKRKYKFIFKCNSGLFRTRCLYATELVKFCYEKLNPKRSGNWSFFLKNIPNIEKKCYSPVVPGFWCMGCF